MATEINKHADSAATAIIEDTLGSNAAYDISQLRKLESKLRDGDIESSMFIVNELIDTKTWQLESCVSEQCRDLMQKRTGKEIYNKALK
ncbi:hypothetical protein [Neptuniibacter sp. 2_MG-2023]|uniref:hypothetical protein n=1 Tax=Neptuniibacter sp. 2_MG-2023 TaxID=3062671 RepID=UPI0026E31EF0|nr:hypothetical protein [Neptuniibacter sp. 2_MG-2023]MDO6515520.1 hypothetical protein [Neptuniibacter sp. 2_MG-2023]